MSSFIAAGTADAVYGLTMIPFFFYYSIFGCQRMQDLIWAAGDAMTRGFLIGGISGRTTMPGEGLQHQDGQSHLFELSVPGLKAYDPAFAYELAVIVQEGMRRMYKEGENIFYYITVINEFYHMPSMPENVEQGIVRGIYRFKAAEKKKSKAKAHLMGSGGVLNEALKAAKLLQDDFNVPTDVWSVTSWKELYTDATETDRWNMLHPGEKTRIPYIQQCLDDPEAVYVCVCDYLKALPLAVAKWMPGRTLALGTDGYGRSDDRPSLRHYFEVDAQFICLATLQGLAEKGKINKRKVAEAIAKFEIDPEKIWAYKV